MRFLIVPGLGGSDPGHWQSLWERSYPGTMRVEQQDWDRPDRDQWIDQLHQAVRNMPGAILIGHSLGCAVIAHLAEQDPALSIAGALLVAPADVDAENFVSSQLREFAPMPLAPLPFPAVVVSSTNDPYIRIERARFLAKAWGARLANAGPCRHINVPAGFGPWPAGEKILDELVRECRRPTRPNRDLVDAE
jgi:predicted alpha/beta hydrolase family esterase